MLMGVLAMLDNSEDGMLVLPPGELRIPHFNINSSNRRCILYERKNYDKINDTKLFFPRNGSYTTEMWLI